MSGRSERPARVLVIGAYGLIGSYVVARLLADGHAVVGCGRDIAMARRRMPDVAWFAADLGAMTEPADWAPHLAGVDAIINCAGALQESPRDSLLSIHRDGPIALYRAAAAASIRRVVHVSAVGIDGTAASGFSTTKRAAEDALRALDLDWLILRPGLVVAPAAFGGSALLRGLAGLPVAIPAAYPASLVQVISVEDVAHAAARGIASDAPSRMTLDLVHVEPLALADLLSRLRAWLGFAPVPVAAVPPALLRLGTGAADLLARLGWRSPMRSTSLQQLASGVTGRAEDAAHLGIVPRSLGEMLAASPSGVQERWFARLYFTKPLGLATLAVFWVLSGIIGLAGPHAAAAELRVAGWSAGSALASVVLGSAVDIALGVLVAIRRTARLALVGMVATSLAYLGGSALARPDLFLDPLGPMLKVLPGIGLALVVLAMMDER